MAKVKNRTLSEEEKQAPLYTPNDKERTIVENVFTKFRESADDRNRNFEYFDGLNLIDYIDDSVRRFTTNIDERENIEDWQARVHNQVTRNKVLAILSKVVQVLPMAQFTERGDEDSRKASILNTIYEYAEDLDDYEELMVHMILEAIVKGTAIGYEGLDRKTRQLRNVTGYGDDTKYTVEQETENRLYGAIIPLEDFYPQHVGIRNIKMMDYCFWRTVMPFHKFIAQFGNFEKAKFVQGKRTTNNERATTPFYKQDLISTDVQEGMVEVIRYYNRETDEFVIIANEVWMNPISIKEDLEVSPIPFNHKQLPFWDIRFDFFGSDFFYGKSLPDRLKSMQDVLNVLENMTLDQSFLTAFPILLTNGFDSIEDDYIRPGRRIPVETQGLPISQSFQKLDLGTPTGWHQWMLEYSKRQIEEASVDQLNQGIAGVGGRTTAREIGVAAEGVASILGLFGRVVNYGIKRKALLKAANGLQFWTDKNSPMLDRPLGSGGTKKFKEAFNIFSVDGVVLTSGKRGRRVIEMYKSSKDFPKKGTLKAREALYKADTGKDIEIIAVEPAYLRSFEYDIKLVPNPKQAATRDIDKAMQLEKVRIYLSFFPEYIDKAELAAQTAEKLGDDPTKVLKKEVFEPPQEAPAAGAPEGAQGEGVGTDPQLDLAGNMVKGLGYTSPSLALRDLGQSMMG